MKPLSLLALALLAACAAQVSHPTKSTAEMQADIDQCTDWANRKYWMDPVAALLNAYDCLEAKGYKRGKAFSNEVARAVHDDRVKNKQPVQPCRVPCGRRK
jgi:hypothetical protein